jgi:hypothetical protein
MSTQAITAIVGNNSMSKSFSDTATDGQYDGNILLDDLGSNPLGILMPNTTINHVAVVYTAGACAWRIIDSVTLQVKRRGWGSLTGYSDYAQSKIQPYTIKKTDTLQVFPIAVDATSSQSAVLAWVTTNGGTELYNAADIPDNTATAITTAVNGQGIGDSAFGQTVTGISVQVEDGGTCKEVTITDNAGGVVYTAYGTKRGLTAGSRSNYYNIDLTGLNIRISKGFILKVKTVSA